MHSHHGAHLAVLPRPEDIVRISKQGRELNRPRILIHLAISKIELTLVRIGRPVGQDELQFPLFRTGTQKLFAKSEIFLFADCEVVSDGVEGRNSRESSARSTHQIADLSLGNTGDAVDG